MNRCVNCQIWLVDDVEICPLCHSVVEDDEMKLSQQDGAVQMVGSGAPYPNIRKRKRKLQFLLRLLLFVGIVTESVLLLLNHIFFHGFWWAAICAAAMVYAYLSLVYWLQHDSGHASKIGLQVILTGILVFILDYLTGATGWSLEWGIPCIILAGDAIVFALMMTNHRQWYSYTLLLLLLVLCSVAILLAGIAGWMHQLLLVWISAAVTFIYLLGTALFGEHTLIRELKRRFRM